MGLFKKNRPKFGELLVEKGLATQKDVEEALKTQREIWDTKQIQKNLGSILNEKGIIDVEDIEDVLQEQKRREGFLLKGFVYSVFHSGQPK
ncbi:MAG: hypothetical protein V1927_05975 [Candidatus Omnitrophota bacterium]